MKKSLAAVLMASALLAAGSAMAAEEKLTVYTSMKESLIGSLKEAFVAKHPEVEMDYYSAGAGKLMAKIAAERESGRMVVDVLWHSEVPDFYNLKNEGVLEPYISPEAQYVESPVKDPEGYFTPARNGTLGIAYNTDAISEAPTKWSDVLGPDYKNGFTIANPALSGTAYGSVAALAQTFGWEFFEKAQKNGAIVGQGSGQVVDDTASGEVVASIAPDYIAVNKIEMGAHMGIAYPEEVIVLPSPCAIIKGTPNLSAAQKFVDFLLSVEGQTIIAHNGTLPVRADVAHESSPLLPNPQEAVERAIKLDFESMTASREELIRKFNSIMHP